MSTPRADLLAAVQECLQRILVADGYNTDAGDLVSLEPAPALAEDKTAFVAVVWSKQERPTDPAMQRSHRLTTVHVIAKVPATQADAQEQLDAICADIEQAMADQQFRYPPGIQAPRYVSAEPFSGPITATWVGVTFTYHSHIPIK